MFRSAEATAAPNTSPASAVPGTPDVFWVIRVRVAVLSPVELP
ncbi:hypothetical protein [Streptomyces sp. NPDC003996]